MEPGRLIGCAVAHKTFGGGKIMKLDGEYVTATFDCGVKKFIFPGALKDGFLTSGDAAVGAYLERLRGEEAKRSGAQTRPHRPERTADSVLQYRLDEGIPRRP